MKPSGYVEGDSVINTTLLDESKLSSKNNHKKLSLFHLTIILFTLTSNIENYQTVQNDQSLLI